MDRWAWWILWVAPLGLAGCRSDPQMDAYLENLSAETLYLEDQLYELRHDYDQKCRELRKLRSENARLRGEAPESSAEDESIPPGDARRDADFDAAPGARSEATDKPPPRDKNSDANSPEAKKSQPPLNGPVIELGEPTSPDLLRGEAAPGLLDPRDVRQAAHVAPADTRITHVVLNPYLTRGHDFDGHPGDDGVHVTLEPRNAADEYVPATGAVSVLVIDPLLVGPAGRVCRWDLTADEVEQRLKTPSPFRGIQLRLPWMAGPPKRRDLRVYARYVTADDRKLEADLPLTVALPGEHARRWTPRLDQRGAPAAWTSQRAATQTSTQQATTQQATTQEATTRQATTRQTPTQGEGPAAHNVAEQPAEPAAERVRPAAHTESAASSEPAERRSPNAVEASPASKAAQAAPPGGETPQPKRPARPIWQPTRPE